MEKEFVKYEIALELKELGFDEPCFARYGNDSKILYKDYSKELHSNYHTPCPTFSQAFRWFREKYELYYTIEGSIKEGFQYFVYTYEYEIKSEESFNIYEEAELACLAKLIEILKKKK